MWGLLWHSQSNKMESGPHSAPIEVIPEGHPFSSGNCADLMRRRQTPLGHLTPGSRSSDCNPASGRCF